MGVLSNLVCFVGATAVGRFWGTLKGGSISGGFCPGCNRTGGPGSLSYILHYNEKSKSKDYSVV